MRWIWLVLIAALAAHAETRTLRLDYYHTGSASEEHFALDGLALEGPWPGPVTKTVDELNLGKYLFEVRDRTTNRLLYSRGFASHYGEWETTAEARLGLRTFHESLRFPLPARAAQVIVKKRDGANLFRELWSTAVDPASRDIDRAPAPAGVKVWAVVKNGEPADKVDLLLLGDGYTAAEMEKWHADAKRLAESLFAVSPFREHRSDFNVWAIDVASDDSGVSRPSDGLWRRSAVGAAYDAFGSERYVLALDNKRLRAIAAAAPYEFLEIVVNGRTYGGGGIHNLYATVASDNASTPYIFVHEFGHHFAALADEYYTSEVAYGPASERLEPWEPNVTADGRAPKWKDSIRPGTLLPSAWPKEEFEAYEKGIQQRRRALRAAHRPEEEMEALFSEELAATKKMLDPLKAVGAYEGANYEAKGYYRSQADCIMFTRNLAGFCLACRQAIERVIAQYTR